MKKINVLIVDDELLIRCGLKYHLNEIDEMTVLGEATNGQEFLDFIKKKMPDVVLMDINMPVMDGIEATRLAMQKYPDLKILVISSCGDEENLEKMMDEGVKGYLLKNVTKEELKDAIVKVSGGKNYFSTDLLAILVRTLAKQESVKENKEKHITLTAREIEILQYISQGFTDKEIGQKCFISTRTAGGHRYNLLEKTGCKNSVSLIFYAIKNGFLKV